VALKGIQSTGSVAKEFGDAEGQLDALAAVQPGIAHRLVAVAQVAGGHLGSTSQAFGDVVAGQLQVDAARVGADVPVGGEEPGHLGQHVLEVAGLATVVGGERVAVHGIAHPHHGVAGLPDG